MPWRAKCALFFVAVMLVAGGACAQIIHVAVASNFAGVMKEIAPYYEAKTGDTLRVSYGSTGKLYAQIKHGAPFDVFFAADQARPARLESEGEIVAGSRFTYAIGRLVLWSPKADYVQGAKTLMELNFAHLALASPKLAPYGAAAKQAMQHLGVYDRLRARFVQGENIGQTFQFVHSDNVALGFVALSQVMKAGEVESGSAWLVPRELYQAIQQDAVILKKAKNKAHVTAFMAWMQSAEALEMIAAYGYAH